MNDDRDVTLWMSNAEVLKGIESSGKDTCLLTPGWWIRFPAGAKFSRKTNFILSRTVGFLLSCIPILLSSIYRTREPLKLKFPLFHLHQTSFFKKKKSKISTDIPTWITLGGHPSRCYPHSTLLIEQDMVYPIHTSCTWLHK